MGILERRQREKKDVKLRILEATKSILIEKGPSAITMRSIANRIEFSPATLYLHYRDKDDILYALNKEGFKLLESKLKEVDRITDAFARLKEVGMIYTSFGREHSYYYELMFGPGGPGRFGMTGKIEGKWMERQEIFDRFVQVVRQCQLEGRFLNKDPIAISILIWSNLHGICMLQRDHLGCIVNTPYLLFEGLLHLIDNAL